MLVAIFGNGETLLPAMVCRREREPYFSDDGSFKKVSNIIPKTWIVFWRKYIASVDSKNLRNECNSLSSSAEEIRTRIIDMFVL